MSNFITEYKKGQDGENKGLPMGEGLINLDKAINGIHRGRLIAVASAPKVGKTTFVDYAFVISPWLYSLNHDVDVDWIYYSFEIDRISKEFDYASYFLNHDYGISRISLGDTTTTIGGVRMNEISLSPQYLRGMLRDDNDNVIRVKPRIEEALKDVYNNRIVPIFGEYDEKGMMIRKGAVNFITSRLNPTGIYKQLITYASKNGNVKYTKIGQSERIESYQPYNPKKYVIVVIDHMRKLLTESNMTTKQLVDRMSEYMVELRNFFGFTFVPIIHTNRSVADPESLKQMKDMVFPGPESIKDTGNISEDADYVLTMFNPNDDRYGLTKHFGITLRDSAGNRLFPNMRTIHLVESRHCIYPQHFRVNMYGDLKTFKQITNNE